MIVRIHSAFLALVALLVCLVSLVSADTVTHNNVQYITYSGPDGETLYLKNDRQPSLYTGNYGDCLGNSLINFTRFDAAYYRDNMTVLFHLEGNTAVANESLVLYISVFAYGETRITFLFNPCAANIPSLCPLNASVPITAQGMIPVSVSDVAAIPPLAFNIPDFEGQAVLRVFANSTQSEIGCYSAVLTNGKSFSHPESVGATLGIFAFITMCASFATAVYGGAVPTIRLHYAHSLSTGVVLAVFQHIFFTGALSMNWPSVLVAWWSNFAWSGGMIYSSMMQKSINKLVGNNIGSTAEVGAAPSDSTQNSVGGAPDISQIYKRSLAWGSDFAQKHVESSLARRADQPPLDGYTWYGHPVGPDLPLPGNYSGFAGTLAVEGIPVSNAFMTGLLWFLILFALVVAAVPAFKGTVELLGMMRMVRKDQLKYFRRHWLGYTGAVALRTCYLGWFAIMFLAIFEFAFSSSAGVKGVAAATFAIFLLGIGGYAAYACHYKMKVLGSTTQHRPHQVERKKLLGIIPWHSAVPTSTSGGLRGTDSKGKIDGTQDVLEHHGPIENIHDNEGFTTKFGWLASRFRRSKWWFFSAILVYELLRACFYAGASGQPLVQVFGLLVIEVVALVFLVWARPFEGRRLNILVVYCLGFSKVASVALSAAFDSQFNLNRITTTVIGIVIIVIQGILAVITLIAVVVGVISSYMSVSRYHDDFRPWRLAETREKYFNHMDSVADDLPPAPKPKPEPKPAKRPPLPPPPDPPYFEMRGVKRLAKIEDEDEEFAAEINPQDPVSTSTTVPDNQIATSTQSPDIGVAMTTSGAVTPPSRSRAGSIRSIGGSSNLPFGARQHRPSWSSQDFAANAELGSDIPPVPTSNHVVQPTPLSASSASSHNRSRSFSRKMAGAKARQTHDPMPKPPHLRTHSASSLRTGGAVSTIDTIGSVPVPTTRPRAGTGGSARAPPSFSQQEFTDITSRSSSRRATDRLTPAQELDEFTASTTEGRSH